MRKQTRNPIEVKATVHFDEGQPTYHIENVSIHYGMDCEHGDLGRKGLPLDRNQEVLNIVKDFLEEAVRQVDMHAEIPEADSVLNYNGAPDNYTNGASG